MVALPFYAYRKVTKKPTKKPCNPNPQTVGEHIRKARLQRQLSQRDVAALVGVSIDCVTYWEKGRSSPQVQHYPRIIAFLKYYPLSHETETLAGKLKQIRLANGFSFAKMARYLRVSVEAAKRWETGIKVSNPRLRDAIVADWQRLPYRTNNPS